MTSGYALTFPVFLASEVEGGAFALTGEVVGTCFALHGEFMMTAGHVAKEVSAAKPRLGVVGLADPLTGNFKGAPIRELEVLEGDVAVLKVEFVFPDSAGWLRVPRWSRAALNPFDPVRSLGFPYGLHRVDEKLSSVQRGFQGHVVSRLMEFKPVGWPERPFPAYELSFGAPRGLSGAPLLNCVGTVHVHGVVIGNSESKMLVFRSEERVLEPAGASVVEYYETLCLGVTVAADFVVACSSRLLQHSVGDFLTSKGLLPGSGSAA